LLMSDVFADPQISNPPTDETDLILPYD